MMLKLVRINIVVLLAAFILSAISPLSRADAAELRVINRWDKSIAPGVLYSHYKMKVGGKPLHIFVTTMDLNMQGVRIKPILANDRLDSLETVPSMASRAGALVAINGSFFNRKSSDPFPVGFIMADGRTLYFSHLYRSAFGLTADGKPLFGYPKTKGIVYVEKTGEYFFLWGMNRRRRGNEALVYTPEFATSTGTNEYGREIIVSGDRVVETRAGDSPIPPDGFVISLHGDSKVYSKWLNVGDRVRLYFVVDPSWLDVYNSLTGGPLLMQNGRVTLDKSTREKVKHGYHGRIPISAVASTYDNKLLLVVVDGRHSKYSVGVTYAELTEFLRSLGAVNAIGMDGGGSSTMWIDGKVMNRPSDGAPRKVSNAIGVFADR